MIEDKNSLEGFAQKLLEEKGVLSMGLEDSVIAQMNKDLVSRMEDRVNTAILGLLPPEQYPALTDLIQAEKFDDVQKLFEEHIPNMAELTAQELMLFRQTYLSAE